MSGQRWRVLIAEDEDLARDRLVRLIGERTDLELVAVCRNGYAAAAALVAGGIDIALLDIEMPGSDGMELLRRAEAADARSAVIFTTAHPQFAVDAFAGKAVDYLLKPFDTDRLDQALRVARERLQARAAVAANERVRAALAQDSIDAPASVDSSTSGRLLVREN
jgi:two-component system LytT family response regulator